MKVLHRKRPFRCQACSSHHQIVILNQLLEQLFYWYSVVTSETLKQNVKKSWKSSSEDSLKLKPFELTAGVFCIFLFGHYTFQNFISIFGHCTFHNHSFLS